MALSHRKERQLLAVAAIALLAMHTHAAMEQFLSDDPISREPDPYDASHVRPAELTLSVDLLSSLFGRPRESARRRATDVNTVGEVPDSSWFTNRIGSRPLTPADIARGPDVTSGPAAGTWTVVSGKSEGVRPGFTIVDSANVRWFLKFDAPRYPEQATGAEVVATKLFWALGYNVAETHIAALWPATLTIGPTAAITTDGRRRRLTRRDVDCVLAQAQRSSDGSYRVLASRALDGKPIGPFLYSGTRSDDPNDVIPHEDRRELRAMRVFAAWIDRVDAKAGNTLDTLVSENGRSVVRHHVLDFGSTLGSGGIGPNDYWEGYQYLVEPGSLVKRIAGVGLPVQPWRRIQYPDIRGVGRLDGDRFDPTLWKSRVPNAAYMLADAGDAFWAARKVMAFSDAMIAAAVESGCYTDPAARAFLTQTLIKRRNAIGRVYLNAINPIVDPSLDTAGRLAFRNAALDAEVAWGPTTYSTSWYRFDNATGETTPIVPDSLGAEEGAYVQVDISAFNTAHAAWRDPVRVWFRSVAGSWRLVGLDR